MTPNNIIRIKKTSHIIHTYVFDDSNNNKTVFDQIELDLSTSTSIGVQRKNLINSKQIKRNITTHIQIKQTKIYVLSHSLSRFSSSLRKIVEMNFSTNWTDTFGLIGKSRSLLGLT